LLSLGGGIAGKVISQLTMYSEEEVKKIKEEASNGKTT
jgi:hypothetical protein